MGEKYEYIGRCPLCLVTIWDGAGLVRVDMRSGERRLAHWRCAQFPSLWAGFVKWARGIRWP